MSERKINHGFWATPTDYQRLTDAARAAGLPLGDYIMMMLDSPKSPFLSTGDEEVEKTRLVCSD